MDSAVNLDSNLVLKLVVAELLVDQDLRGVCNLMLGEETEANDKLDISQ